MRDNSSRFVNLEKKLGRKVQFCEICGQNLMNKLFFIKYKDRHSGLPHQIKILCQKCYSPTE